MAATHRDLPSLLIGLLMTLLFAIGGVVLSHVSTPETVWGFSGREDF
jgi:hypothetical protein